MRNLFKIVFFFIFFAQGVNAQDVGVTGYDTPVNGCELDTIEDVFVFFKNNKGTSVSGVVPSYQIDGGGWISGPSFSLGPNASFNYTFSQPADLSLCDHTYTIDVKLELTFSPDENPADNFISWTVRNDCHVVPGTISADTTVCEGVNNGTLTLNGWEHGILKNWSYSEDNATWTPITGSAGALTYDFSNLTETTYFLTVYDEGFCAPPGSETYSLPAIVTVQPTPNPGNIIGDDSFCISNATDELNLNGNSTPVLDWESSVDSVTWNPLGNTSTSLNFSSLTQTTMYRAQVDGGVCTDVYTDVFTVEVSDLSDAGVLNNDSIFCGNGSLDLVLTGFTGDITGWESSSDGITWNPESNNLNDTLSTGNLTSSTYYRASVMNGACPEDVSNQVFIEIFPELNSGTISGDGSFCESNVNGSLTLSGNSGGNVVHWESSTDEGSNWSNIANTSTIENFSGISQTTWYRALIDGGACANKYSDTAIVQVSPISVSGSLAADASVCQGVSDTLTLTGNTGAVVAWDYSDDGTTWIDLNANDSSYIINPVMDSRYYRVIVKSGLCDEDTTNVVFIDALDTPVADAGGNTSVLPGDSVQLQGSGGIIGHWVSDSTLSDSTIYNPFASPSSTTTYTLYVINANGCFDSDQVTVAVGGTLSLLDIKNVITANDDGYNDTWIIEGVEFFPNMDVKVYNIYGNLVYQNESYQNDWTGEYKGDILPDGTYMYVVMPGGTDAVLKGNLTILGGQK